MTDAIRGSSYQNVFVLAVWVSFENTENRDVWITLWRELAEYVKHNEPGTLSYELSIADTDPSKVLVYERYKTKADLTETHVNSAPFKKFKSVRQTLPFNFSVQGQSYYESNIGYM